MMRNERWREGRLSTEFIAEEFPDGFNPPVPTGKSATLWSRSPPSSII